MAYSDDHMEQMKAFLKPGQSVNDILNEEETPLLRAMTAKNLDAVRFLLDQGADPNLSPPKANTTALIEASSAGLNDFVRCLLDYGAKVGVAASSNKNTALHVAAFHGHLKCVQMLVEAVECGEQLRRHLAQTAEAKSKGKKPPICDIPVAALSNAATDTGFVLTLTDLLECANCENHNVLMMAAAGGFLEVVKYLVQKGANVNSASNILKETPLTIAVAKNHTLVVQYLIQQGADVNHCTEDQHTALLIASQEGLLDMSKLLIENGASVHLMRDVYESPITMAACYGHLDLVALLLAHGAHIDSTTEEGLTALMEACRDGHEELATYLLSVGADVNVQTWESHETALILAASLGFTRLTQLLIDHGADVNAGCSTALMEAAQEGHLQVVKILLAAGADPNITFSPPKSLAMQPALEVDNKMEPGDTALQAAVEFGHFEVVRELLHHGANVEQVSQRGMTVLMMAATLGRLDLVRLLVEEGNARLDACCPQQQHSALSLACVGGHLDVVNYLLVKGANRTARLKDGNNSYLEAVRSGNPELVKLILGQIPPDEEVTKRPLDSLVPDSAVEMVETTTPVSKLPTTTMSITSKSSGSDYEEMEDDAAMLDVLYSLPQSDEEEDEQWPHNRFSLFRPRHSAAIRNVKECLMRCQQDYQPPPASLSPSNASPHQPHSTPSSNVTSSNVTPLKTSLSTQQQQHRQTCTDNTSGKGDSCFCCPTDSTTLSDTVGKKENTDTLPCSDKVSHRVKPSKVSTATSTVSSSSSAVSQNMECPQSCPWVGSEYMLQDLLGQRTTSNPVASAAAANGLLNVIMSLLNADEAAQSQFVESNSSPSNVAVPVEGSAPHHVGQQKSCACCCTTTSNTATTNSTTTTTTTQTQTPAPPTKHMRSYISSQLSEYLALVFSSNPTLEGADLASGLSRLDIEHGQQHLARILKDIRKSATGNHATDTNIPASNASATAISKSASTTLSTATSTALPTATSLGGRSPKRLASGVAARKNEVPTNCTPPSTVVTQSATTTVNTDSTAAAATTTTASSTPPSFPMFDLNSCLDSTAENALHLACANGHEDVVRLLLKSGANPKQRDRKVGTPLHVAVINAHLPVVQLLLANGAEVDAPAEKNKDSALHIAANAGRLEIAEALVRAGANVEYRNANDYTPLCLAASNGHLNVIKMLVSYGADVNARFQSKLGIVPLMLSAMNGHLEASRFFLDNGSDVNAQIETNRNTALTLAAFQGRVEIVKLLAERRANLEHRAKTGLNPLMEAASGGYTAVGKVLLQFGADVNPLPGGVNKDVPLTLAAEKGHAAFVKLLLEHGAYVETKNKRGATALFLAAANGHTQCVEALMEFDACADTSDQRHTTALISAFRKGHSNVVKALLKKVERLPSPLELQRYIQQIAEEAMPSEVKEHIWLCEQLIEDKRKEELRKADMHRDALLSELAKEDLDKKRKTEVAAKKREKKKEKKRQKKLEKEEKEKKDTLVTSVVEHAPEEKENHVSTAVMSEETSQQATTDNVQESNNTANAVKTEPVMKINKDKEQLEANAGGDSASFSQLKGAATRQKAVSSKASKKKCASSTGEASASVSTNGATTSRRSRKTRLSVEGGKNVTTTTVSSTSVTKEVVKEVDVSPNVPEEVWHHPHSQERSLSASTNVSSNSTTPSVAAQQPCVMNTTETTTSTSSTKCRHKILHVPDSSIGRVIGQGGNTINAIRQLSSATIDISSEKDVDEQKNRLVSIRGRSESVQTAITYIQKLVDGKITGKQVIEMEHQLTHNKVVPPIPSGSSATCPSRSKKSSTTSMTEVGKSGKNVAPTVPIPLFTTLPPLCSNSVSVAAAVCSTTSAATCSSVKPLPILTASSSSSSAATNAAIAVVTSASTATILPSTSVWAGTAAQQQHSEMKNFAKVAAEGVVGTGNSSTKRGYHPSAHPPFDFQSATQDFPSLGSQRTPASVGISSISPIPVPESGEIILPDLTVPPPCCTPLDQMTSLKLPSVSPGLLSTDSWLELVAASVESVPVSQTEPVTSRPFCRAPGSDRPSVQRSSTAVHPSPEHASSNMETTSTSLFPILSPTHSLSNHPATSSVEVSDHVFGLLPRLSPLEASTDVTKSSPTESTLSNKKHLFTDELPAYSGLSFDSQLWGSGGLESSSSSLPPLKSSDGRTSGPLTVTNSNNQQESVVNFGPYSIQSPPPPPLQPAPISPPSSSHVMNDRVAFGSALEIPASQSASNFTGMVRNDWWMPPPKAPVTPTTGACPVGPVYRHNVNPSSTTTGLLGKPPPWMSKPAAPPQMAGYFLDPLCTGYATPGASAFHTDNSHASSSSMWPSGVGEPVLQPQKQTFFPSSAAAAGFFSNSGESMFGVAAMGVEVEWSSGAVNGSGVTPVTPMFHGPAVPFAGYNQTPYAAVSASLHNHYPHHTLPTPSSNSRNG